MGTQQLLWGFHQLLVRPIPKIPSNQGKKQSKQGSIMSLTRSLYEQYWTPSQTPPDSDPLTEERVRRFLESAEETELVLDIGCGNGRGAKLLTHAGKKVIGLDISSEALRRASNSDGISFYVQGDCDGDLPFAAQSFEAVFCAEVIEHLLDPVGLLRECHRVLRPRGILCVSTPYHARLKNVVIAAIAFERHFDPVGPHIRFFTLKSLRELLERNGFRVRQTSCLGRFWPLWMNMMICAEKL
jgi:SAM-dependent methyltransferase